jgi:hypothetical protein
MLPGGTSRPSTRPHRWRNSKVKQRLLLQHLWNWPSLTYIRNLSVICYHYLASLQMRVSCTRAMGMKHHPLPLLQGKQTGTCRSLLGTPCCLLSLHQHPLRSIPTWHIRTASEGDHRPPTTLRPRRVPHPLPTGLLHSIMRPHGARTIKIDRTIPVNPCPITQRAQDA